MRRATKRAILRDIAEYMDIVNEDGKPDVDGMLIYAASNETPGYCYGCGCIHDYVESDAEENYCDACDSNCVVSVLVIAGII